MSVTIWHNPRCSKSRATLALLEARGIEPEVRLYLKTPPAPAEILEVSRMLGRRPIDFARRGEAAFAEHGLSAEMPDAEVAEVMAANPILIERPIVIANGTAAIGRPPEAVLEIL